MHSIPPLPAAVIFAVGENPAIEAELWAWASAQHYAIVVEQNRDDLLVFVQGQVDFTALEKACALYHIYSGHAGQAPTYTIGQLCRALVVKYLHDWSYRRTAAEVRGNSLVRWFVGYGLQEETPDYITLWRFEKWVMTHAQRRFFDETLGQIDQALPEERERAQIGDTFALISRAHEETRTQLLRNAGRRLLNYLAALTPNGHAQVVAAVDVAALFGTAHERPERYLEKSERDALELRTATAAHHCLQLALAQRVALGTGACTRQLEYQGCLKWEAVLAKLLKDEFTITTDDQGHADKVIHPEKKTKGSYRRGSTVDLDATFRVHGDFSQLGYNANVAVTINFVREINAMAGAAPDSTGVADLIANQKEHLGFVPHKLIYDRAAGMPKIFADVAKASDNQTQLVARLIDYGKSRERFGPMDFTVDAGLQLTCPNGKIADGRTYSGSAQGWNYRFTAAQCAGCPLMAQCRGTAVQPRARRQVFISEHRYFQQQALDYTKTAAFLADMKLRPHVERVIAALTRYNGARRAAAYGMDQADFQLKMCAMAYNLKRWHKLTLEKQKAQRYQPPSADG